MEGRSWTIVAVTALLGSVAVAPGALGAQDSYAIEARVWTDRGEDPVLQRGERVRLYYRVTRDAYVAIFNVDTDGTAHMVFPRSPEENHYVRGGQDYRLLFPRSPYWSVEDDPGVGYYFIVASPEPFDFSAFRYSHYGSGWDLSHVGRTVYRDPYQAIDDYVAYLIPDWEYVPYALDFVEYRVGQASYRYPRFLCYDCHGFRSYQAWNPYRYTCLSFRVVIFDHPYYYPRTRYRGSAVVYTRPPVSSGPRFAFKERGRGEPGSPMVVSSAAPVADRPGVRGDPAPRRPSGTSGTSGSSGTAAPSGSSRPPSGVGSTTPGTRDRAPGRSDAAGSERRPAGVEPAPPRRPSAVLRGQGGERAAPPSVHVDPRSVDPDRLRRPSGGGTRATPPSGGATGRDRPILQRRPGGGSGGSASPPSRPPARVDPPVRRSPPPSARSGGGSSSRPSEPPARAGGSTGRSGGSSGGSARPSRSGSSGGGAASSRRPPTRRPSGGGGGADGPERVEEMASRDRADAVSVTSLAGSGSTRSVPVASYRPAAPEEEDRTPEGGAATHGAARTPAPVAASGPETRPDGPPAGSRAGPRRSAPSSVVMGASGRSESGTPSRSSGGGSTWVVQGARPAATPSRSQPSPRASSPPTRSVIQGARGSGTRSGASRAVVSGSGRSSGSAPATRRGSGSARSSGSARRPSPPPRRDPPRGGGG